MEGILEIHTGDGEVEEGLGLGPRLSDSVAFLLLPSRGGQGGERAHVHLTSHMESGSAARL